MSGFKLPNREPIVGKDGMLTPAWEQYFASLHTKTEKTLDLQGQVTAQTKVAGRTEGIGTTVQNLDSGGIVTAPGVDLARAYVNKDTDHITDGTGSPLSGGKRGQIALDANSRLAGSFRNNPANVSSCPTSSSVLSNNGVATVIVIAASTSQYGDGTVSYNSGSVDPGVFGTYYIYADDPTFAGGAVSYGFSTTPPNQCAANGRIPFGKIVTLGGSANTGGGYGGGNTPITAKGVGGRGFVS